MTQNISCDCEGKTCRHQFALTDSQQVTFSTPPSSPEPPLQPHIEAVIDQVLTQALGGAEANCNSRLDDSRLDDSRLDDSQPMILDEDANDGYNSDPERFVQ